MLGLQSGFITRVKEKIHLLFHREALASRTLPTEMRNVLNVAIKVVNFAKCGTLNIRLFKLLFESEYEALLFHTNVQWLSEGNMLGRLYELREVTIFLDLQQKADLHDKFQSEGFQLFLAYPVDIFEALNALNLKLQGKNINILTHHDTIRTLKKQIITHLTDLKTEFIRCFPDIEEKREAWKFIRNPFHCEVTDVLDEVQEEFLELKFNSPAKEDFKELDLEMFRIK
ncbi:Hypothetical predicted protein [Octopus vulgaris]|uniref:Protein FAM200A-like n=1 Tax=Octopus vulgaris TaxID=6645 RepID=A0AA36B6C4_OCTVU|nr:Hypothetical predicted protein [Octopus vulgaris]